VHTDMELWSTIRRRVLVEGVSKREICRDYKLGWRTLDKIVEHAEPPGYRLRVPRVQPVLGPFMGLIDQILEDDRSAPPKQRHTARRIFHRLRDEHDYRGSETQVRRYVSQMKRHGAEVCAPLSHPPGEAQFDFGEATVVIAGERVKAAFAVMTLPFSDAWHMSAYPRECTETFQAAHIAAFEFFGGVPTRTTYDNTTIAVKKVIGRERELTREFLRLESHFLFKHHFCRVGRGNEKGVVEGLVGYGRRNTMVPVPEFASFAALNDYLDACCIGDLTRRVRGKADTKAELLEIDRTALLPLPKNRFEVRRVVVAKVNSLSLVRFDCNDYSVPTAYAHHDVTVIGSIDDVRIALGPTAVARHLRCWAKERTIYDPRHYLSLLAREPGAFDLAKPLEGWELPECFAVLRRRLEADLGLRGTREFIDVLCLLEETPTQELAAAVDVALALGTTSADGIHQIVAFRAEGSSELFRLDGLVYRSPYAVDPPDLLAYDALVEIGT
jgi:transposase